MGQYSVVVAGETTEGVCLCTLSSDGNVLPQLTYVRAAIVDTPDDQKFQFALFEHTAIGAGGSSVTPEKMGPFAAASGVVLKGTFSTPPTKNGNAKAFLSPHRRGESVFQKAFGEGFFPLVATAARGLSIWVVTAPSVLDCVIELGWWE